MNNNLISYILYTLLLIVLSNFIAHSQNNDGSLAFKKNRPQKKYTIFYQPDLSYQIQKQFNLIRDANTGNPLAQHELGLRYLLGEGGFNADTVKGAYWVEKAADQNLTAACFNYGILLINGWGVEWNPFKAFDYFMKAANDGMAQAQHLVGILYTDNLIVKRDYVEAYNWVKKASDQNYSPALETKKDLEKHLSKDFLASNQNDKNSLTTDHRVDSDTSLSSQLGLVFIDFESIHDTITEVTDKDLINDLFRESNISLADSLGLKEEDSTLTKINSRGVAVLEKSAESGNPEALTVLGRMYERGLFYEKDLLKASLNYILASQLDYPRAKVLLLKIITQNFVAHLVSEIKNKNNLDAMFTFYGLWNLGLSHNIIKDDAIRFLVDASNQNHFPSMIELGNNYYTGKNIESDISKGITLWRQTAEEGSIQAKIRLAAINIIDAISIEPLAKSIQTLKEANSCGSILAQISLAFAYENGIGVLVSKTEAVKYYRLAAQRGNQSGYEELKRIYDEIRPNEKRFIVN